MTDFSTARLSFSPSVPLYSNTEGFRRFASNPAYMRTDSQIYRDALVQTNTNLLLDRWPYMGNYPETTMQMAQTLDPFDAATQGDVLSAQHTLMQRADSWNEMPEEEQRSLWGELTEPQQQAIIAAGGKPPQADDGGWLGDILDAGAKATGFVLGGVGSAISIIPGGTQALSALTIIGNAPLAVYRGIRQLDSWQQGLALAGGLVAIAGGVLASPFTAGGSLSLTAAGFGTLSTIGAVGLTGIAGAGLTASAIGGEEYRNAVINSWDGERAFLPDAQNRAQQLLENEDLYVIAKSVAYELDPYEIALEFAGVANADDPDVMLGSLQRLALEYGEEGTPAYNKASQNLLKLYSEERFREAVKILQQGKISIGRDLARGMRLDPDSDLHRLVSGSADALTIFAMDPLLVASPAAKFARFARYSPFGNYKALRNASRGGASMLISKTDNLQWRVDLGNDNAKVRAMDEQIMEAINTNNANLMPKNMRPIWSDLRNWLSERGLLDKNFLPKDGEQLSRAHLYRWMMDANGMAHIAQGISTVPGLGFTAIKPISNRGAWGTLRKNLREFRDELIDSNPNLFDDKNLTRLEEVAAREIDQMELGLPENTLSTPMHDGLVTIDLSEPIARQTLGAQLGRTSGQLLALLPFSVGPTLGTFFDAVSNMAPKRGYIALDGTEAADEVTTFVNAMGMTFNMSKSLREQWIQTILGQGDVAQRLVLIQHFYDSIFEATGFKSSFRGQQLYEEFMQKFNQNYGVGGIDEAGITTANGTVPMRTGVMPGQSKATNIAIPDVRELIKAQRLDKFLSDKIGYTNPGKPIDWYQNRIWKPSVVLRIGFIPRAIGEEALAWVARGTTGTVLAENRARKLLKMDQRDAIVNRLKNGETIEVIHDGVKRKLNRRMKIDDLTPAERRLLAGYRNPNDVKRLERIVTRRADATNPITAFILEYEKFLRKVLDPARYVDGWQTSGRKRFVDDIDSRNPVISALLLGKEHSWRRLGLQGVDQRLLSSARVWYLTHADATMKQWSAGSLSYDPKKPQDPGVRVEQMDDGSLKVQTRIIDHHSREIYTPEQSDFAYALHRAVNEITEDEYFGEAITRVLLRHVPDQFGELEGLQNLLYFWRDFDWATQSRYIDALFNRPDRLVDLIDKVDIDAKTMLDNMLDTMPEDFTLINDYINGLDIEARRFVLGVLYEDSVVSRLESLGRKLTSEEQALVARKLDVDNFSNFRLQFNSSIDFENVLLQELQTLALQPQIREVLNRSRRTVTLNGEYVANRIPTNYRRVYVPEVRDFTDLRRRIEIERAALGSDNADLSQIAINIAEDLVDGFALDVSQSIPSLRNWDDGGREVAANMIANSIFEILQNQYYFAPNGWVRNAGFTDPRVALEIGELLSGNLTQSFYSSDAMGYIDVPNQQLLSVGDEWEGVRVVNTQSDGLQMMSFDEAVATNLEYVRGNIVADADGNTTQMFGISEQDALTEQLQAVVEHIKQTMTARSKVVYQINPNANVFIAKGKEGTYQRIDPDQLLSRRNAEQMFVYDKELGDFVEANFDDRRIFTPQQQSGDGLMYQLVTPALMDRLDEVAGFPRLVRKNVANIDPVTGKKAEGTDFVRATWSRSSDVDIAYAPDEVVGPKFKTPEVNMWDRVLAAGFDRVVTPMIDSFLREPMAFHNFILAREENMQFLRSMLNKDRLETLTDQIDGNHLRAARNHRRNLFDDSEVDQAYAIYDYVQQELWVEASAEGLSVLEYLRRAPLNKRANISRRLFGEANDLFSDDVLQSFNVIDQWANHVDELSSINAMKNMEPFLDTAENKSMFSQYTKNLLPFWYAEENFIKRWFRTASNQGFMGLETIRKGQLAFMGLRHAGIIRTDENGNSWVVIPGSGLVQEIISKAVPGAGALPIGVLMQANTNSLLPGFNEQAGSPAISPFATMPLAFASSVFPEMQNWERAFAGDIAVDRSLADKFFPSSLMRFQRALTSNEQDTQFASAMVNAMLMLEARGDGLPPDHTPEEKQEYLDKLADHARIIMFTRAVLGFVSPGSPSPVVTGESKGSFGWWTGLGVTDPKDVINSDYYRYLTEYGYEEGVAKFLEENEYASVFDIVNPIALVTPQTETIAGANIPPTEPALQWYDSNSTWSQQNPYAAAWLVPNEEDDKFSQYVYGRQIANGLRRRLSPSEMIDEVHYKTASTSYYPQKDFYENLRIANANNPYELAQVEKEYAQWKLNFNAVHPIFAARQTSPDGRLRRQQTLEELRRSLTDPMTPKTPAFTPIRQMIEAYDKFEGVLAANKLNGRSANNLAVRRKLISDWQLWVQRWLLAYPSQRSFYDSIIAGELDPMVV